MNFDRIKEIARAVLYEGYILYPYRPSAIKNRQRWTFGGVFPHRRLPAARAMPPRCKPNSCCVAARRDRRCDVRFLQV